MVFLCQPHYFKIMVLKNQPKKLIYKFAETIGKKRRRELLDKLMDLEQNCDL